MVTWPAAANRRTSSVVKLRRCVVNFHKQQQIYEPAPEGELLRTGRRREKERGVRGGGGYYQAPSYRGKGTQSSTVISLHLQPAPSRILTAHIPLLWVFTHPWWTRMPLIRLSDGSLWMRSVELSFHACKIEEQGYFFLKMYILKGLRWKTIITDTYETQHSNVFILLYSYDSLKH